MNMYFSLKKTNIFAEKDHVFPPISSVSFLLCCTSRVKRSTQVVIKSNEHFN